MRWTNLTLDADEQHRLPGYRDEAVVRRFDAPEALDIRFYEIRARSILNRVPGRSPLPAPWTINPYRGCTHACSYCLWGGTPILMANGRCKPLAHVEVGEAIYGTAQEGARRRLAPTRVLDKWSSLKSAYRVVLADGTELLASGDHRFLSARGWKHVTGAKQGPLRRPYLTCASQLLGPGRDGPPVGRGTTEGALVKAGPGLRVVAIEPLGMAVRMYDITTTSGDFIADGVVSHNCFARPTHRYLDFDAGRDFEREIVVKVNAPELLRAELARPSWRGEHVALGTNTDPYQWVEGRYKLMVGIWEAMRDAAGGAGNPCSVLTKSPLLLRDLPLMLQIAQRAPFSACLSIPTLDERAWRASEPHTPNPRARLEAVAELNRAGIPTGVLIAPLMPGINDAPQQLEPLLQGAIDAGASSIGGAALHLRGEVKDVFMQWLRDQRPELVSRYERLYARGGNAPREERERLAGLVRRGRGGRRWPRGPRYRPVAAQGKPESSSRRARDAPEPTTRAREAARSQESLF
jgi:DNA repair photolyase